MRRGRWYRVKIPELLLAGYKFVVRDTSRNFHIVCTVPIVNVVEMVMNLCSIGQWKTWIMTQKDVCTRKICVSCGSICYQFHRH